MVGEMSTSKPMIALAESEWGKKIDQAEVAALARIASQPEFARETDLFSLLNLIIRVARNSPAVKSLLRSAISIIEHEESTPPPDIELNLFSTGQIESVDENGQNARCYMQSSDGSFTVVSVPLGLVRTAGLQPGDEFRVIPKSGGMEFELARSKDVAVENSADFGSFEISDAVAADCEWALRSRKTRFREFQPLEGDYVAILNRTVVGSGTSETELRNRLAPIHHVDPGRFVVEHIQNGH